VTTEDDFQHTLDTNPDDNHTRMVFADWLDEHSDPRAEGYRLFLARPDVAPFEDSDRAQWTWFNELYFRRADYAGRAVWSFVPSDLFAALEGGQQLREDRPSSEHDGNAWRDYPSRRAAEDAAARAFAPLPAVRRAALRIPEPKPA
jgi:uncharacterized protein (TIGR02996 family)